LKRLGIALAVLAAVTIAAVGAISVLIPAETVRAAIKSEIEAVTGLKPTIRGNTSVSVFPWGTISFGDLTLGDEHDGEPALVARRLTARLRLIPLLFGRIETADLSLIEPRIVVRFGPEGGSNWSSLTASLTRTLKPVPGDGARQMSFSEIRIADGKLVLRDARHGLDETLTHVEMSLAWPSISKSLVATGRFAWRDQPVDATISLNDLAAAVAGDRAGLKIRLSSEPLRLAFDGHVSGRPTVKMDGTLAADTGSLRQTLSWAGFKPLPGGGFGRFALKAHTDLVGGTIALSSVNLELDGNSAEGVLAFTAEGRPVVQGTLAADDLDLTPYVSTVHLLRSSERDWSRVPIVLDGLTDFDVDLRLSAARIDLANARLGRTAVAANLRDGHLTVTIGESQAEGIARACQGGCRRRDQDGAAIRRRRSRRLPRRPVRDPADRRQRHAVAGVGRIGRERHGDDRDARRHVTAHRDPRLARRLQRRAAVAPAGAPAALRRRRLSQGPHRVRQAHREAQAGGGSRGGRGRAARVGNRAAGADRFRLDPGP
jgi:AsmA protein